MQPTIASTISVLILRTFTFFFDDFELAISPVILFGLNITVNCEATLNNFANRQYGMNVVLIS